MHIKRFEGATLDEAIARVKAELGPEAILLSQKTVRRDGGWFGIGARGVVEVTAAVDRDVHRGEDPTRVRPDPSWQELRLARALVDPLEGELRYLRRSMDSVAGSLGARRDLFEAVEELMRGVAQLRGEAALSTSPPDARAGAGRLIAAGISPRHAVPLALEAMESGDPASLRHALAARLDRRMLPPREDSPSRFELFVGPTGAGKTTTLAKLAARNPEEGLTVLTTDSLRLGADAPLRELAQRIGASFRAIASPEELPRAIAGSRSRRVLVDTAGRSHADASALSELVRCREALGAGARVQLVLPATTKEDDLRRELDRYRPLAPDGLAITKLDESGGIANVVNVLLEEESPRLFWVGDGQRIPEDLKVPDPEGFAGRILEEAA